MMNQSSFLERIKDGIQVILGTAKAIPLGTEVETSDVLPYSCPVCSSAVEDFERFPDFYHENLDKNQHIFSIFQIETLNHLKYLCPICEASDRDRLYALYLNRHLPEVNADFRWLDIAPCKSLQTFIQAKYPQAHYRSADRFRAGVDDVVDITQMDIYADNTFDFLICSHVLEHVEDDRKAISELYRVLKPGGKGIIMVPILLSLEADYENPEITTPEGRWQHFGQNDHVRMYSKPGFIAKLRDAGFTVHSLDINAFGSEMFDQYGIHPRSVLYIVEKV